MEATYNVYRVSITQLDGAGPDHVAITLVPTEIDAQDRGRWYHVTGNAGMGMEYECRPGFNFGADKAYKGKEFHFSFPKSKLAAFEEISRSVPPPHDTRVLMVTNTNALDPPAPDCATWVKEVLDIAKRQLQD
ncbi:hypothetical protein TWF694_005090 [Orbilia ellipsospora]|uniref:Uncharacterized protein n=1 Tax=Orbilia ellipsospora TaxID=2528407 RepID=A0AAV9X0N4_9PEZI